MSGVVIVESPSKAKTIEKYLDKKYKVYATVGHIIDLPKNKLGVDVDKDFEPDFITIKGKGATIKKLKKEIKGKKEVLLATDPDREGEAIAWHTANALGLKDPKRVVFYEITKSAVQEGVKNPRPIDIDLVQSQIARRVLDRLVGYKLSEVLWKKIWYGLSAGRVQSVALRLLVEREREILAFNPKEFWDIFSHFKDSEKRKLKSKLSRIDDKKAVVPNGEDADRIEKDIKGRSLTVKQIKTKQLRKHPFPPFTTSTLQQAANNILGFSAKRTMGLAQVLYQSGYITYMRTDSVNLASVAVDAIRKEILKRYGKSYLPDTPNYYKGKSRNAQEAHEAIRPTDFSRSPDQIGKSLGAAESKLYKLIYNRTVASQMVPKVSEQLSVAMEVEGGSGSVYTFSLGAEKVLFDGFRKLLTTSQKDGEELYEIESLKEGDQFKIESVEKIQNFTKPKPRYTDASLVKALEKYGIGRPSTYATIISTVQDRGYVEKDGRFLKPLDVGFVVSDFLTKNFERLVDFEYTAKVEEELDLISEDKVEYAPFIEKEYRPLTKEIKKAEKEVDKESVVILGDSDEKCDKCGAKMVVRLGRYGKFLSCSTFPECKGMKSLEGDIQIDTKKYKVPDKCPECGAKMVLKSGKYGKFWACERYPECKGIVSLLLHENCPECGKSLVERKGRWGKSFIGCSGYPDCRYIKKVSSKKKKDEES